MDALTAAVKWVQTHPVLLTGVLVGSLLLAVVYAIVIFMAIARMNPNYFVRKGPTVGSWRYQHPGLWLVIRIAKNLMGTVLVFLGLAMLVLPGQGVLTILIGISLLEFPGKRRLELSIVMRPAIRRGIDRIRARAGTGSLNLPES